MNISRKPADAPKPKPLVSKQETTVSSGNTTTKQSVEKKTGPEAKSKAETKLTGSKFTKTSTADKKWSQTSYKKETTRETQLGKPADEALTKKLQERGKKLDNAQKAGNFAADALGLKKEWKGSTNEAKSEKSLVDVKKTSADGKTESTAYVGAKAVAKADGKLSVGADGIKAEGKADARAGLYAEVSGKKTGDLGTVEGKAGVKAEAYATASGSGKLDLNGLEVKAKAAVGAEISASVSGKYTTPSVTVGGQKLDASIAANGRAALEAKAEAEGKVAFTGNPPKAIVEGSAGASAVAKLEGDVKASAGPFSVTASGYVSAGAEAKASGVLGYEDGKLKIGGSLGAALGVGAGGKVQVEVDVAQIGKVGVGLAKEGAAQAAKAADLDGDGKLGVGDLKRGAENLAGNVAGGAKKVAGWFGL
jgi:hypothetical protein